MKRGRGGWRKGAKETHSNIPDRTPSAMTDSNRQFSLTSNRDSDVTYGSSRPSSTSSIGRIPNIPVNDRSFQATCFRNINDYLAIHNCNFSLKHPLPSAKDINDTIRFIFHRLGWPSPSTIKLDEDLPLLLTHLKCPIKLNKSALKAPGTPHAWPSLLAVINWLVDNARYSDQLSSSTTTTTATVTARSFLHDNKLLDYAIESYSYYIQGNDQAVEELDREFQDKMAVEIRQAEEKVEVLEKEAEDAQATIDAMRSGPSTREALEKDKLVLEVDVHKFHDIIDTFTNSVEAADKELVIKEKELEAKVQENLRICEENEELKKRAEAQTVNLRDAERMRRELQAVERDIIEAESARNTWEEKSWDLDATVRQKFKEIESLSMECNQAIRRLKLRNDFQYMLNPKGSTPAEILGIDYKATLKPALDAFAGEIKKSSMEKLEDMILLQQQSKENDSKFKARKSRLEELQSWIDVVESQITSVEKEIHDFTSRCSVEVKRMDEEVEIESHKLDSIEREAEEFLKISRAKLQDVILQSEEQLQICARELLALVDSVSQYKERMESTVLRMKRDLSETTVSVANAYKDSIVNSPK